MAISSLRSSRVKASVNNGRRQPLQGFDTSIYIQDQSTGNLIPFGEFTGFQYTIRNATEPYLPLGHRNISLLDGEFQIGWSAEQGKVNLDVFKDIMGFQFIGPNIRLGRSPRFQIVVEFNAPELDESAGVPGYGTFDVISDAKPVTPDGKLGEPGKNTRLATGRYVFQYCKIDAMTTGIMAGRSVIADRIEGLAENAFFEPLTPATAKFSKQTLEVGNVYNTQGALDIITTNLDKAAGDFNQANAVPDWAKTATTDTPPAGQ